MNLKSAFIFTLIMAMLIIVFFYVGGTRIFTAENIKITEEGMFINGERIRTPTMVTGVRGKIEALIASITGKNIESGVTEDGP